MFFPVFEYNMTERKSESEGSVEKLSVDDEEDVPHKQSPLFGKMVFNSPKLAATTNSKHSIISSTGTFDTESVIKSGHNDREILEKESTNTIMDQVTLTSKEIPGKSSFAQQMKQARPKTNKKSPGKQFGGKKGGKRSPLPSYYLLKVFNQSPTQKCSTPQHVHHPMGENVGSKLFSAPNLSASECALCKLSKKK